MFRIGSVLVVVAAVTLSVPGEGGAQGPVLPLGKKFEGELKEMKFYKGMSYDSLGGCYATEVPISLKAGQTVLISATVVGKGRITPASNIIT